MKNRGFTLVELMVAVAIFTIVMMVAMGAVFSVVSANRKSQSLNVVINNLNFAFESMIRDLRTGNDYEVSGSNQVVTFLDREERLVRYSVSSDGLMNKKYLNDEDGDLPQGEITDPEVVIENLSFDLVGDDAGDNTQLLLRIHIRGKTGNPSNNTESTFNIETLIAPRSLDYDDVLQQ